MPKRLVAGRGVAAHEMSTSLLAVVEAALRGRDDRFVAKCDVPGILAVFERWDIYDVPTLAASLESSFAALQNDLEPVAALSFLGLLKATLASGPRPPSPGTPSSAPPTAPPPPFHQSPLHPPPPLHPPNTAVVSVQCTQLCPSVFPMLADAVPGWKCMSLQRLGGYFVILCYYVFWEDLAQIRRKA